MRGLLRTSTRPTLNLLLLLASVCACTLKVSRDPISVECLISMTLHHGGEAQAPVHHPLQAPQAVSQPTHGRRRGGGRGGRGEREETGEERAESGAAEAAEVAGSAEVKAVAAEAAGRRRRRSQRQRRQRRQRRQSRRRRRPRSENKCWKIF